MVYSTVKIGLLWSVGSLRRMVKFVYLPSHHPDTNGYNQPFTISWRDSVRSQVSMGRTFVDGVKCGVPKGINKRGYKKDPSKENDTAHQRGISTSTGKERQLVFSKVDYTGWSSFKLQGKKAE